MSRQEAKERLKERYNRGAKAEKDFILYYKAKYPNHSIKRSSRHQNMFEHIDILAGCISYDVKSLKKKRAKDKDTNSTIIWVEFRNTRGNLGWLYGKADRIAFELESEFISVKREELRKIAESLTIKEFTNHPKAYHLYGRRFNREQELQRGYKCADVMTFLYLKDIEGIIEERIPKNAQKEY